MKNPIAVLISDVHYSLKTLELADNSMRQAINKANALKVPLVVAGDLHDTKANLRGECVNAMIETFKLANTTVYVLIGNHDKINEKSDDHSLNFLSKYVNLVKDVRDKQHIGNFHLAAYQSDVDKLRKNLRCFSNHSSFIMHQGLQGSNSGEYIKDVTALAPNDVAGRRIISGHYHRRQTLALPDGGQWDYIGNPYTQNFAEANDPEKGYQILHSDGSLEFIPTNLRKHIVYDWTALEAYNGLIAPTHTDNDLVWVKLTGSKEELAKLPKDRIKALLGEGNSFKLTKEVVNSEVLRTNTVITANDRLDFIIEQIVEDKNRQTSVKELWRKLQI